MNKFLRSISVFAAAAMLLPSFIGFHVEAATGVKIDSSHFPDANFRAVVKGYDTDKNMFYYRSRNDKEVDFVLRKGTHVECLVQVCYDMSSTKTEKREVDSIVECAGELKCSKLNIVTLDEERTIEKDGYTIDVVPVSKF